MKRIEIAIAAGSAAALGAVAATVWVGLSVREDTVVAHPYEDGLRQDAERHARAALGLTVSLPGAPDAGAAPLAFELRDRDGRPVDDAVIDVELSRAETSRGERAARAVSLGGGRWSAEVAFPEPGPWDVRLDVVRGKDRVRLERRVGVRAACDLAAGACTRPLAGGGEVVVEVSPRPVRVMKELSVRVQVREPPHPGPLPRGAGERGDSPTAIATPRIPPRGEGAAPAAVTVSFAMPGMTMGENRSTLAKTAPGVYEGKAVLVRCATGRRGWIADVELVAPGIAARTARFPLTLPEDAR